MISYHKLQNGNSVTKTMNMYVVDQKKLAPYVYGILFLNKELL